MADIVLRDRNGAKITYPGITEIKVNTADGGTQNFVAGDAVEATVDLDFSEGLMSVFPEAGELFSQVDIPQPETLIPENIRYGTDIAGIEGEFIGDTEEIHTEADFSDGNHIVVPTEETKVISKVTIQKPSTLVPENIAKDVDVGGVVGTFEGGGFDTDNLVEVFPVTEITVPSGGDGTVPVMAPLGLEAGSIYQIIWNGVSYIREAENVVYNGIPAVALGNGIAWGGENTGEPFAIGEIPEQYVSFTGGAYGLIVPLDGSTTFKVGGYLVCDVKEQRIEYTCNENGEIVGATPYGFTVLPPSAFRGIETLEWVDFSKCPNLVDLGLSAFYGCTGITEITIPDSITNIGTYAFYGCTSLTSITIPDGVTSIGKYSFYNCSALQSVYIPDSVTSFENCAFQGCTSLTSITIPDGVTSIGPYAFHSCTALQSITIPDGVTNIGTYAFYGCTSLTSITIPDGVTSISNSTFYNCTSLASVTLGSGLTSIENQAFINCTSLTSITIPDGVTSISGAFRYCTSLASVTLGSDLTSIGTSAFYGCTSLTSITIPDGVTSIESMAFQGCTSLASVTIGSGVTLIGNQAFYQTGLTYALFKKTSGWWRATSGTSTSGTTISSSYLANTSTAATYLKSTYYNYYWKRT